MRGERDGKKELGREDESEAYGESESVDGVVAQVRE